MAKAKAKANTEKMIYAAADAHGGFDAIAILPLHVIGPLMCLNHDQSWSWQNCIKFMMNGKPYRKSKGGRMLWNLVDVRDVARAHRLAAKTTVGGNGSRYILSAEDRSSRSSTIESVRAHGDFDGVEQLPLSFRIHTRRTAPRIGPA